MELPGNQKTQKGFFQITPKGLKVLEHIRVLKESLQPVGEDI